MARLCVVLALTLLVLGAHQAWAEGPSPEFRVIIHPDNPASVVSKQFLSDAFLKKVRRWDGDEVILPVDQPPDSAVRHKFSERILKRSVAAVRSYWQQRIFSGRDVPPPELDSDEEVVEYVGAHPGAVGYVAADAKLHGVRELVVR